MVGLSPFINQVLWGVLIILFAGVFIFALIVHGRMMRKHLERGSIFSPLENLRGIGTPNFLLFIFLVIVLGMIVAAMEALKNFGL
jgi:cell division protein FtsX